MIANSGSGNDITGTSSLWSVSAAGAGIFASVATNTITASATNPSNLTIDATGVGTIALGATSTGAITLTRAVTATASITITGTADTNCLTVTAGDVVVSNGKFTLTNDDTDSAITVTAASVTTGNVLSITADGITTGAIAYFAMTEAGITSGNGAYIECYDSTAGATQFHVSNDGATTITGNASGTASLTLTAGDLSMASGAISVTNSADATVLALTGTGATTVNVFTITANSVTSGSLAYLATSLAGFTGKYIQCYDGVADDFSVGADGAVAIVATVATTQSLIITANSATTVTGGIIDLDANALTTGILIKGNSTSTAIAAGELLSLDLTSSGTTLTAKTGSLASIVASQTESGTSSQDFDVLNLSRTSVHNTAGTLTAAGAVLKLTRVSTETLATLTDSVNGLEIVTGLTSTGSSIDIANSAVAGRSINIASACTTVSDVLITGSGVKANNKGVLEVVSTGATAAGGSLLRVATTSGTPATATSYLVDFDYSGATMTNNPVAVRVDVGSSTGAALQLTGSGANSMLELLSTATGAVGAVLRFNHTPGANAEAAGDVVSRILFTGQDDADANEEYGRIDCILKDAAAAAPDGALVFYTDKAGTSTQHLAIGWDSIADATFAGILVGTGAATGLVSSQGAYDLTLETNGGTNSGTIVITDAANGNITVTPNGTGRVSLFAPSYGQITALADGAATLTVAQSGLVTMGNTVARILTLPAAASNAGLWYTVKKTSADAFAITLDGNAAETIDGAATFATVDAQYDVVTIVCDGSNWHVVNKIIA